MVGTGCERYCRHDELTNLLVSLVDRQPGLFKLQSIGKSHEGRDIWLVTASNSATGPDREKPAVWVDGNIHAMEIAGSSAALNFLYALAGGYGRDELITRALDTRAFYVVPRASPDGVELALAAHPRFIRSSTRTSFGDKGEDQLPDCGEQRAVLPEESPQGLRYRPHKLPVWEAQEQILGQVLPEEEGPFLTAGGAEEKGLAGERAKVVIAAV